MNQRRYLKVYKKFLHTSLASELEYKTNISGGLSMQIIWIFLLFPLFKKIWSEGTKKYTAMGS